jgi:hypothetical protein
MTIEQPACDFCVREGRNCEVQFQQHKLPVLQQYDFDSLLRFQEYVPPAPKRPKGAAYLYDYVLR